jgi:hypothetical protein
MVNPPAHACFLEPATNHRLFPAVQGEAAPDRRHLKQRQNCVGIVSAGGQIEQREEGIHHRALST